MHCWHVENLPLTGSIVAKHTVDHSHLAPPSVAMQIHGGATRSRRGKSSAIASRRELLLQSVLLVGRGGILARSQRCWSRPVDGAMLFRVRSSVVVLQFQTRRASDGCLRLHVQASLSDRDFCGACQTSNPNMRLMPSSMVPHYNRKMTFSSRPPRRRMRWRTLCSASNVAQASRRTISWRTAREESRLKRHSLFSEILIVMLAGKGLPTVRIQEASHRFGPPLNPFSEQGDAELPPPYHRSAWG